MTKVFVEHPRLTRVCELVFWKKFTHAYVVVRSNIIKPNLDLNKDVGPVDSWFPKIQGLLIIKPT